MSNTDERLARIETNIEWLKEKYEEKHICPEALKIKELETTVKGNKKLNLILFGGLLTLNTGIILGVLGYLLKGILL